MQRYFYIKCVFVRFRIKSNVHFAHDKLRLHPVVALRLGKNCGKVRRFRFWLFSQCTTTCPHRWNLDRAKGIARRVTPFRNLNKNIFFSQRCILSSLSFVRLTDWPLFTCGRTLALANRPNHFCFQTENMDVPHSMSPPRRLVSPRDLVILL
jgi:hypothetical protein